MIVVNFFGAPGAGKTTAAMELASFLKRKQVNAEYVSEFAKDQVWAGSAHLLAYQNWVFANQELKLSLLASQVDVVATDSPLPLSVFYSSAEYPKSFRQLCFDFFGQYQNVNIFLRRSHPYCAIGRIQGEAEAVAMEQGMLDFLNANNIPFTELSAGEVNPESIHQLILNFGKKCP